jgi:NAD(P)-dependent dehydrogenase (short-subunit alcohol dehydrogenase family)
MGQLNGRVALITGAGSGIGWGIAELFAREGAAVSLAGRTLSKVETVAEALRQAGCSAQAFAADVSKKEDGERLVAQTVERFGGLHILVNNAGVAKAKPLVDTRDEEIESMLDIDLKGPIYLTRAAIPHLQKHKDSGGSSVLNISSSVTLIAVRSFSVYSAAKAGLDQLTRCLALDLAADRIRVNAICPGVVETPIFATMMPKAAVPKAMASFAGKHPLGRVGQPEDIAAAALYLCGPGASWVTGVVMPVDGGISLGA